VLGAVIVQLLHELRAKVPAAAPKCPLQRQSAVQQDVQQDVLCNKMCKVTKTFFPLRLNLGRA